MKKYIFVVLLLASAMTASAQTWKNVTYPFRMTSIDGESVSLQAWMDSGYYVVLDFFAVWCGPCWSMHTAGVMEKIYEELGPEGEDIVRVAMIEIDNETTTDAIRGTGTRTMGDWTSGGTVPFPIIDNATAIRSVSGFYDNSIPYTVFVTPDGRYREFTQAYSATSSTIIDLVRSYIASAGSTAGIDDMVGKTLVLVFPNPVSDRLTVEADGFRSLEMVDMEGRRVLTSATHDVEIGTLAKGLYMVRIVTDNGMTVRKIVKK